MAIMLKIEVLLLLFCAAKLCHSKSTGNSVPQWPEKVTDRIRGDHYLVGDIMFTEEQMSDIMERKLVPRRRLWPRNKDNVLELKFAWDPKPEAKYSKDNYRAGHKIWMENTCVVFTEIPFPADEDNAPVFLKLSSWNGGCTSRMGLTVSKGPQWINLGIGCGLSASQHETGHCLGFYHEQCRSDRDDSIKMMYNHLPSDYYKVNYDKYPSENYGVPYDYGSLMHYNPFGGRKKGEMGSTMETLDPRFHFVIGEQPFLSFMDLKLFNTAYKCIDDWKKKCVDDPCKNGGYIRDNSGTCKCVCPDGTKGANCEALEMTYNEAILKQFSPLSEKITAPTTIASKVNKAEKHTKWIVAPKCKRVVVTFKSFELQDYKNTENNCKYDWIEIQIGEVGKGQFFCGKELKAGQKFVSEKNSMVVHLKTDGHTPGYTADVTFENIPGCS